MTCECCHCCFCCCEQNYDPNPNDPKKRKTDTKVQTSPPNPTVVTRSLPVTTPTTPFEWPVDIAPQPETVEDWINRPPQTNDEKEEEEQFDFPPKTPEEPPPPLPVPGCTDPSATNYNPNATVSDGSCTYPPPPLVQWTPNEKPPSSSVGLPTRYTNSTEVSQAVTTVDNQGPTPGWMSPTDIEAMEWDGVPISDPYGKTPAQLCAWMFKSRAMRGLRQLYASKTWFTNDTNPTVAEIDNWNLEVIRHFRRLLGITTPVEPRAELYLETAWGEFRYAGTSSYNSINYPGTFGSAYGPCVLRITSGDPTNQTTTNNAHCGATFVPSFTEQAPFLTQYPGLQPFNFINGGAEAVTSMNTNLPWALKLPGVIMGYVCSEGLTGHAGPFATRTQVGMAFFATNDGRSASTRHRIKWLG